MSTEKCIEIDGNLRGGYRIDLNIIVDGNIPHKDEKVVERMTDFRSYMPVEWKQFVVLKEEE